MRNKDVGKRLVRFIYNAGIRGCRFSEIQRFYVETILNKNYDEYYSYDENFFVRHHDMCGDIRGVRRVRRYRGYGVAFFKDNNIIKRCCIKNDLGRWVYAKDV
jgi:hypothetical protein